MGEKDISNKRIAESLINGIAFVKMNGRSLVGIRTLRMVSWSDVK